MSKSSPNSIRITASVGQGQLTRERIRFNSLVKKLEAERSKIALWREQLPNIYAMANSDFHPLVDVFNSHRRKLLLLLDGAYHHTKIGKTDREKISVLICSFGLELLQADPSDAEVKEIVNRHRGVDYDQEVDDEKAFMRSMVSKIIGVEVDEDIDFDSPADLLQSIQKKMAEQAAHSESDEQELSADAERGESAKPAKLSARELQQQEQEAKLKQSVREIFRKLASTLHPDREADPLERQRKTALMQRANVAYAADDLLGLLELQLEVDQIDQSGLDNLSEDRIKQYNLILNDQYTELKREIDSMKHTIASAVGWGRGKQLTPNGMRKTLRADILDMRAKIIQIEMDLLIFEDVKQLKKWLKDYKIDYQYEDEDEVIPFFF